MYICIAFHDIFCVKLWKFKTRYDLQMKPSFLHSTSSRAQWVKIISQVYRMDGQWCCLLVHAAMKSCTRKQHHWPTTRLLQSMFLGSLRPSLRGSKVFFGNTFEAFQNCYVLYLSWRLDAPAQIISIQCRVLKQWLGRQWANWHLLVHSTHS